MRRRIVSTDPDRDIIDSPFGAGTIASHAVGGATAAILCEPLFGRSRIGGILATRLTGTSFGAFSYPTAAAGGPDAAASWLAIVPGIHTVPAS